ncbi:MAG: glyoxalase [Ruminococcus sp.]|nr:glyoxalase [Ruminococcus sp.]
MKIEHIALYVNDLERARDFFVNYFGGHSNDGYHNKTTGFRSFFISFDDGARLELMNKPDMVDSEKHLNRTGYAHLAFSAGSKEKVDELTEKLQNDGFRIVSGPRTTGDGYYESCVVAIEDNQIEITI